MGAGDGRAADVLLAGQHPALGLAAPGRGDPVGLALGAQLELVLGGQGEHAEHEPAFLGAQVEVLGQRHHRHAAVAQLVDGGQHVGGAAAPPVGLPELQRVAGLRERQQFLPGRPEHPALG